MTCQWALLRLLSSNLLGSTGQRLLQKRVWTIESGEGAGLKLNFPQNLEYISGSSEVPVQKTIARQLRRGDVFLDIGANVGFFSLIAARIVGQGGCVYSFEPVAENAALVRANAQLNGFRNMRLFEVAVAQNSRSEELLLTGWDGGAAISASVVKPSAPVARRAVQVVALDDLIPAEDLQLPNFVKIDVEGVELEVIQGMMKTIAASRPVLLYEIDDGDKDAFGRRWREVDALVSSLGYEIVHLEDSYPDLDWNVGHSLAMPHKTNGKQ